MLQQVEAELSSSLYAEAGQDNTARETGDQKPAKNQEAVLLEESKHTCEGSSHVGSPSVDPATTRLSELRSQKAWIFLSRGIKNRSGKLGQRLVR